MHPSSEIEREYAVRINGKVSEEMLQRLRSGIELDDGPASFQRLVDEGGEGANRWFRVTVKEGRNRLVRRLWESQEVQVSRLIAQVVGVARGAGQSADTYSLRPGGSAQMVTSGQSS